MLTFLLLRWIYTIRKYIFLYIRFFAKQVAMKFKGLFLFVFVFIFSFQFIFSQDLSLSILTIPDSLTKNANSVIRFDDTNVEFVSQRKMIIKIKKAVTVLNELGDSESKITVHYDKNRKIKSLKAIVFNSFGTEIKKISKKDFKDYAAADGISLFNDGRIKYYRHVPISYPYTIYYEYEYETSNTAFIPRWYPFDSYNQSIQKSTYDINFPNNLKLKSSEKKFNKYKVSKKSSGTNYYFEINNSLAIKYEEYCPSHLKIMPSAMLATNKFHLEGFDGIANDWREFGKWMYDSLIASRMDLPETTKIEIKNLVRDVNDPIEKAKIVYDFVQKKTRYISVQVGIGGWMPMLASDVDRLSYGDCKALTNYTKALMDEVDVESYYTAVYGGRNIRSMENDVVSVQGNHAFLYVPSKEKDYWLECTSQTVPFGYQGTFTDDRDVLVIKPEGGEIKHTNIQDDKNSFQKTNASYKINPNGSIDGEIEIKSAGIQYDNHYRLEKKPDREINKYYKSNYWSYINNLIIDKYYFVNNRDSVIFKENVTINARDYATFSGDRILFTVNAFNRVSRVPKRYRNRKLPLEISRGFIDIDEFEIVLPDDYKIEALAKNVFIENKFGEYKFSIEKISDKKLIYSRTYLLKKGFHPKEDYKAYRNFRKQIAKYDKTKIVLIKK